MTRWQKSFVFPRRRFRLRNQSLLSKSGEVQIWQLESSVAYPGNVATSPRVKKAMVIISDGLPDDEEKAVNAAKSAKSLGVRIITIGVPGANEAFLKKIASASDLATLTEFENLGDAMDKAVKLLPRSSRDHAERTIVVDLLRHPSRAGRGGRQGDQSRV